jgi:hypothetical protein
MDIITSLWLSIAFDRNFKNTTKFNLFNYYIGYKFYNVMYIPGIKLNELEKIKC